MSSYRLKPHGKRQLCLSKLAHNNDRHYKRARFHIKMAARTDFTGKYGLPLSEKKRKNLLAAS